MSKYRHKIVESMIGFGFILPSLLGFSIFLFYPFLKSIYLSLFSTNAIGRISSFVGFRNYMTVFKSEHFYQSLLNSCEFALLTIPAVIVISLLLAVLTKGQNVLNVVFQFIFAISIAMPVGMASVIWKILFHPTAGMLNYWLGLIHIRPIGWLTDPAYAMLSVSMMTVWMNMGFVYLVILSGVKGIPEDLYESAKMDGAGAWSTFFKITLPLLSPTLFFVSVVSLISSLQAFGQINILTQGGPVNATNVLVYDLYREAFKNYHFGSGSAQAIILFVIILVFTLIQFRLGARRVHYS
ncbi:sugar ABC transporter permease [Paenibacillus peoriae]|uniref:carbohydrate ABC transporter permease n=1 Tax=Paenibacillus peoriae TaxID=59893 RepID=UPI00026C5802|nr:sugar ABC transporter permease [Paenibacillus peoriae]MEC0182722.1 sugar ABC transporter permease [Paenibacillus peoriae]